MKRFLLVLGTLAALGGCGDSPTDTEPLPGVLTITFDDGWLSAYTRALPALQAQGLRANVGLVTSYVDQSFPGFLSLSHLELLHQAGWSIVSHSVGHADLTTLTDVQLEWELSTSKAWIQSRGFRGSSVFIVPYHSFGERELAAIRRHYAAARVANSTFYLPSRFEEWRPDDPHALTSIEAEFVPIATEAGRAALEQQISAALADGKFVDLLFHDITPELLPAFEQTVAMLAKFRANVHPYHELFP